MGEIDEVLTKRQIAFLGRLSEARERLLTAIDGLGVETLCTESVIEDWTIKDILGHIVSWNDEFRADIEMILQGNHPGYDHQISGEDDFNSLNQHWIALKTNWSWERIRDDIDRDYGEAVELIERLQPKDYRMRGVTPWKRAALEKPEVATKDDTESVETLITYQWRHIIQHAKAIEKWREKSNL
jgi:hypothetical protein